MQNVIWSESGDTLGLDVIGEGLMMIIIPLSPPLDSALDIFYCGLRFTSATKMLDRLNRGEPYVTDDGKVAIETHQGKISFRFAYDHNPNAHFRSLLSESSSTEFLSIVRDGLAGELDAFPELDFEIASKKVGRNELCPCGSGRKFKKCCLRKDFSDIIPNELRFAESATDVGLRKLMDLARSKPSVLYASSFWSALGTRAGLLSKHVEAKTCLAKAHSIDPVDHVVTVNLAVTLHNLDDTVGALQMLETVPHGCARKEIVTANILQDLGRHTEAIPLYEAAIDLEPEFYLPYARLLGSLSDDDPLYEHWLEKARHTLPKSAWIARTYCLFLLRNGRLNELADATWIDTLESEAGRSDVIGRNADDPKLIVESQLFRRAARLFSGEDLGLLEDSVDVLRCANKEWNLCDIAKLLATVASNAGRPTLVEQSFGRICSLCRTNNVGLRGSLDTYLAVAHLNAAEFKLSSEHADRSLAIAPDNPEALWCKWWSLDELGKVEDSILFAEHLLAVDPDCENLPYNLGWLCGKVGWFGRSKHYYLIQLKSDATHLLALENMVFTHLVEGEIDGASRCWGDFESHFQSIAITSCDDDEERDKAIRHLTAKRRKFDELTGLAERTKGSTSYAIDMINANNITNPRLGADTRLGGVKFSVEELIKGLGHPLESRDILFQLEMMRRGDLSLIVNQIATEVPSWKSIPDAAQAALLEAEKRVSESGSHDSSPEVVSFAKAVEITLKHKVFESYRTKYGSRHDTTMHAKAASKDNRARKFANFVTTGHHIELGSMGFVLDLCNDPTASHLLLIESFKTFISTDLGLPKLLDATTLSDLKTLASTFRNPAAHSNRHTTKEAETTRNLALSVLSVLTKDK